MLLPSFYWIFITPQLVYSTILNTQKEHKDLDPMLVSVIAHLKKYLLERKNRGFRNWFKDKTYDQCVADIENSIVLFGRGEMGKDELIIKIDKWQKQLPSSKKEDSLIAVHHTKLRMVLDNAKAVIEFYNSKPTKEAKKIPR